jgi:ferrochelatase
MQGRDSFLESGGEDFEQIPCLNESPAFIEFLAGKVEGWQAGEYESPKATPPAYVER